MLTLYNVLNLCGWACVYHTWMYSGDATYGELLAVISVVQCFAVIEPLMIITGKVKSSLGTAVVQLLSRLIFPFWFFQPDVADVAATRQLQTALGVMCFAWSVTEMVRSLFYLTKYHPVTLLRYNLFVVLYPVGVFGETLFIATVTTLTAEAHLRLLYMLLCGSYGVFFPMLYGYMFKQRAKMYRNLFNKH